MRYFLLILLLLLLIDSSSQIQLSKKQESPVNSQGQYTFSCGLVEKDPQIDLKHWQNYLLENLELNSLAHDTIPKGVYRLTALILIGKNGCIEQVKIVGDPGYGLGDKVSKVISSYQQWIPAERNGRRVRAYRRQDITFVIEKETKECEEEKRLIDSVL